MARKHHSNENTETALNGSRLLVGIHAVSVDVELTPRLGKNIDGM